MTAGERRGQENNSQSEGRMIALWPWNFETLQVRSRERLLSQNRPHSLFHARASWKRITPWKPNQKQASYFKELLIMRSILIKKKKKGLDCCLGWSYFPVEHSWKSIQGDLILSLLATFIMIKPHPVELTNDVAGSWWCRCFICVRMVEVQLCMAATCLWLPATDGKRLQTLLKFQCILWPISFLCRGTRARKQEEPAQTAEEDREEKAIFSCNQWLV